MEARLTKIALLIPLSFILVSTMMAIPSMASDEANNIEVQELHSSSFYTAGSTVQINYYNRDHDVPPPTPVGGIVMHYTLKDADGNVVWRWEKEPDIYRYDASVQYAEDTFLFEIPTMWGRPSGEWTLEAGVYDEAGDPDMSSRIDYKFEVSEGGIWDNVNAPVYIWSGQGLFGFELGNIHAELPEPILFPVLPLACIGLFFIGIKYLHFVYVEGKGYVLRSKSSIGKAWENKGQK